MEVRVTIAGRPNVGKSTLFNKLVKKNSAIVYDIPGITRDRIDGICEFGNVRLKISDTAGFDNTKYDSISVEMIKQSVNAMKNADVVLFLIDGRENLNYLDIEFAKHLRKIDTSVILVCNKCESKPKGDAMNEIYALGFKKVVILSAEHKIGFEDLFDKIKESYKEKHNINLSDVEALEKESQLYDKLKKLSIAIVGRPNAGKSTLFNKILGEYRAIVSDIAGTTRDSIHQAIKYGEYDIDLVDTAGIRKRLHIDDKIEEFSVQSAFYSIKFATTVVLCMDATQPFESQDLAIARFAVEEGRGAIIVLNKWDLLSDRDKQRNIKDLDKFINNAFPRIKGVPFFTISAKNDQDINEVLDECILLHGIWSKRINTARLNAFVREITAIKPPSKYKNHSVKIKFATQVNTRPMAICIFTNIIDGVTTEYQNFLENEIRNKFGIFGVPIRIILKKSENPFEYKTKDSMYKKDPQVSDRFKKVVKKSLKNKNLKIKNAK